MTTIFTTITWLWVLTLINMRGVKEGAILQAVMTVLKLLPFFAIIGFGVFHLHVHIIPRLKDDGLKLLQILKFS